MTEVRERAIFGRAARRAVAALLVLLAIASAGLAAAQALDYQRLIQLGQPAEAAETETREPLQSLPAPQFDPSKIPDATAYGQLGPGAVSNGDAFDAARDLIEVFRARAERVLSRAPDIAEEFRLALQAASPTGEAGYFLAVLVFSLLLLAIGRAVKIVYLVYVARPLFMAVQRERPVGYLEKLPVLVYRIVLTLIGAAISVIAASATGLVYYDRHEATLTTAIVIFGVYFVFMVVDAIWRMGLSPHLSQYRIPTMTDDQARRAYRWMSAISALAIGAIGISYWAKALGVAAEIQVLLTAGLTLFVVAGLIVTLRANRDAVRAAILAGVPRAEVSWLTLLALRLWMPVAVLYLIGSWAQLTYDLVMGVRAGPLGLIVPYLVLLGGVVVYAITNYAIERIFSRSRQMRALNAERAETARAAEDARLAEAARGEEFGASADVDGDGDEEGGGRPAAAEASRPPQWVFDRTRGMRTFEDLARRIASLFAIGAAAWGIAYYWGGPGLFAETMALGIAEDLIDILLIGYILFHAIRIWIDQKIEEEVGDTPQQLEPGEGEGGTGASRLATLLPLVRNFILALISIAIALAVASEVGVNVAPLFAGAGILGLAIGFGSQTLVRDILSGAFFLMDDAFRKGEYVDVGSVKGTVEKISLRSFQLRHHLGMLHTIPFGEIGYLTNYSRDWVMMKLPLRVTYDTDVERVRKLIKKLGQDLLEDPTIGDRFLAPLKSQGVIQMDDSAMIIRVKFMTKPGEQWVVRKRVYQEIRALFEREGIKFAHREVTVRIPDLERGEQSAETTHALGAAARTAVDVVEAETLPGGAGAAGAPNLAETR